jgi:lycopene beta-cyclase
VALRFARTVAESSPAERAGALEKLWQAHIRQARFARMLNRLLFAHFAPEDRWNVLARFYRLPTLTVRRFYALETTTGDRLRILCGRPPAKMSWRARRAEVRA